jgi:prephenate dehydrogenase
MAVATIIGGAGRMGDWFARFLRKNDYRIVISDKNKRLAQSLAKKHRFKVVDDPRLAVRGSQLVILATPIEDTATLLKELEPQLSPTCLLVEISSIKEPLRATLQSMRRRGVTVLSIHPMFGPGIRSLAGKPIIVTMLPRTKNAAYKFLSLFRREGARIIRSDFEQHDKYASVTLALPHFMNIALVNTLRTCRLRPKQLVAMAGTTFRLQLIVAEELYQENFCNEASILMDNKHASLMLRTFVKKNQKTLSALSKAGKGNLLRDLHRGKIYLRNDPLFQRASVRFNQAVEASSLH